MRRRSRLLRVTKWGGVAACVLVATAWIFGAWYSFGCDHPTGRLELRWGILNLTHRTGNPPPSNQSGFAVLPFRPNIEAEWLPRFRQYRLQFVPATNTLSLAPTPMPNAKFRWTEHHLSLPLWMLLTVLAVPTALLSWPARRPPPGHCPCGYDLRGNVSGRCPECGTRVRQ